MKKGHEGICNHPGTERQILRDLTGWNLENPAYGNRTVAARMGEKGDLIQGCNAFGTAGVHI